MIDCFIKCGSAAMDLPSLSIALAMMTFKLTVAITWERVTCISLDRDTMSGVLDWLGLTVDAASAAGGYIYN